MIQAHLRVFLSAKYRVTVVAGRGEEGALPKGAELVLIPEMDSQHPQVAEINTHLEQGRVPPGFEGMVNRLIGILGPILSRFDNVIVHNVFTKHFNLPLTAALHYLLNAGKFRQCVAWCHDFTWTSPRSRSKAHPGHPWDLLRTFQEDVKYVVVSKRRQQALAALFGCSMEQIRVIYNGVDPQVLLGLSREGRALVDQLGLLDGGLVLLMPVRVTQAKNIEFALRVVAALKERRYRPKLVLTGPPDPHDPESMKYYRSLQTLRRDLGVEDEMRFVFESGPDPDQPFSVDMSVVGDLYRVCDAVFIPSHREGFGMPILEAGFLGVPVICSSIPAAQEIGGSDINLIDTEQDPAQVAERILAWAEQNPMYRLRRRVRRHYTWTSIFEQEIRPLLEGPTAA